MKVLAILLMIKTVFSAPINPDGNQQFYFSINLIDLLYSLVNINVQPVEVLTAGQLRTFLYLMLVPTPTINIFRIICLQG